MSSKLPYAAQPGSMVTVLNKVKQAKTPERFNPDFLTTTLGCKGGNYKQFIPLAKKLGLLNTDGSPTDLYRSFRNGATSQAAMAQALKIGYREVFDRNEGAGDIPRDQFRGLVIEITGLDHDSRVVQLICQTFESLKKLADFKTNLKGGSPEKEKKEKIDEGTTDEEQQNFKMNLAYTINLVLPKTDDPAVFNAIFKSLKENLLRK